MKEPNREAVHGTGSAATMNVTVITCNRCGKAVTPAIPRPSGEPLAVRAHVECLECIEKNASELEAQLAVAEADARRNMGVLQQQLKNCHETMQKDGVRHAKALLALEDADANAARLCGQVDDAVARLVTAEARLAEERRTSNDLVEHLEEARADAGRLRRAVEIYAKPEHWLFTEYVLGRKSYRSELGPEIAQEALKADAERPAATFVSRQYCASIHASPQRQGDHPSRATDAPPDRGAADAERET